MSKSFMDLVVYQRALDAVVIVYEVTSKFPVEERYGLTAQLRKAANSVCSNIAEGQGRLTRGEQRQFLSQARGSLFEVESHCIVAERLKMLNGPDHQTILRALRKTGKALSGFIRWVLARELERRRPSNRATQQPSNQRT